MCQTEYADESHLCEFVLHRDFKKLFADMEIYVDGIASMQIQNLNSLIEVTRNEVINKYNPGEDDPHLRILNAAIIDEDDYFLRAVQEDIARIMKDIRSEHSSDQECAPVTSVGAELKKDLDDVANFQGSPLEKQAFLYCKRLGINYKNLSSIEFQQLMNILNKSKHMKGLMNQKKIKKK